MRYPSIAAHRHHDGHKSWGQMPLMTGSCELCFTKWLIGNLWPRRRAFAHGGNYKRRGKWSRCGAGSTGLEGHVCVNSPLRPRLPGSLVQPPAPAHTESKEARGVYSCGCKEEKGNEEYLVWKPYRRHGVNPLALYLHLLISHNILIKPSLWETARAKKWRRQRLRLFMFSLLSHS